ncbi:glycosyltransferase [Agromyces marinus]|nr:glycosyltransferase [Agromyces marinus]
MYACASLKEEFGLALLEAMATGLFVVAPDGEARRPTSSTA